VFLSAPCKGFSGLLSETKSLTGKYQALNRLTLRGVWLMLEAYKDDPVELILFENVPRIATRGRHLLDQITGLLRAYGYAVAETTHDCGEIGGLAQSRKRFLLVARHQEKVPPFLYEPEKKQLRAVGDVLGKMPLPGA
jgi:site-specific DNA-cytosine methylase